MGKKKKPETPSYDESDIRTLDWREHIRSRPGMYIGKTGGGGVKDDGIYVLIKEVMDNSIDEFVMGNGKRIDVTVDKGKVTIRDHGRGIPLGKVVECVSQINTGAKYDSSAFKKSVGLNGVGTKAVNALSSYFEVTSYREGKKKSACFEKGELTKETKKTKSDEGSGTKVVFVPDDEIFKGYQFKFEFIEELAQNYCYLNRGLKIYFNGKKLYSKNGLRDLLDSKLPEEEHIYQPIHLTGDDIEVAFTHTEERSEEYYTFVNGQHTTQGGTHLSAFKESVAKVIKEHFNNNYEPVDIRKSIFAAMSIKIVDPVFESQTKTKLGSTEVEPGGEAIKTFIYNFLKNKLENVLLQNKEVSDKLEDKIKRSQKERKELAGIKKLAKKKSKESSIHNKKLKDCKVHLNDKKNKKKAKESTIFLTEGESASGSIIKARDVDTQAVFSLKGKPMNSFGKSRKIIYENDELHLIQSALNIEDNIDDLRYNRVILATDADVDGMHIRLLLMTFFLQFFPELVERGHVHILETPLYRVRDKNDTHYCYNEQERIDALNSLKGKPEITRFKGLGEISPEEFKEFITPGKLRTRPVQITDSDRVNEILKFFMGKNTQERQNFIVENLRTDKDVIDIDMAKGKK